MSLRPLPPIAPMQAMFNLLFRFWPRKSVGTPNASAPAAREVVFIKSRRSITQSEVVSADFSGSVFDLFDTRKRIHLLVPKCSNQAFAASLSCISRMTIVKTSTSYFACTSPAITAATLSSIWFQPSS